MLIAGGIGEAFASIGIWIVAGIYKVAATAFEIFLLLADGSILNSIDYGVLINNIYVVIGIVMLFILAFSMLKGMVNPDDQNQGTSAIKKIIINIITSAIIMAVLPGIFTFAFDFQTAFVNDYNPIAKMFGYGSLDSSNTGSSSVSKEQQGAYQIVNGVYTAFFNADFDQSACKNLSLVDCQKQVKPKKMPDGGGDDLSETINKVETTGRFGLYSHYAHGVDKDEVEFQFLLALVAGFLLIYVGVSFCFDMAVRLVKLVVYQMIAPIPIFLRIMPNGKLSGTFNEWVQITLACYMEVYTRIFVFYFCVFLCINLLDAGFFENIIAARPFVGGLTKAFVLMGIITFMKQAPGLIAKVTGVNTGDMKLGIREKLAAGGAFTAGAIAGGGATALARNGVNAFQNSKNKFQDIKGKTGVERRKAIGSLVGSVFTGLGSVAAGGVSGAVRSGKAGWGAKDEKAMKSSASAGASAAVNARDKRAAYKASHGENIIGATWGHIKDVGIGIGEWAGIGAGGDAVFSYYSAAAQQSSSFNDLSESTYKKKPEYIEQSSKVKALEASTNGYQDIVDNYDKEIKKLSQEKKGANAKRAKQIDAQIKEIQRKQAPYQAKLNLYNQEQNTLDTMQKTMAAKKADVISIAATQLSANQKSNYSNDQEFVEAYKKAIYAGFGFDLDKGRVENERIDGNQRIITYTDAEGKTTEKALSINSTQIFDAMLSGSEVKDEWIKEENVIFVQKAIDKANIGRQHIKTQKERAHIMRNANKTPGNKDGK